jgi:hypothetical protein
MRRLPPYWKSLSLVLAVLIVLWVVLNLQYGSFPSFLLPL